MKITFKQYEDIFNVFKEELGREVSNYLSEKFSDIYHHCFDNYYSGIEFFGTALNRFEVFAEEDFDGVVRFYVLGESRKISVQSFDSINTFLEFVTNSYWVAEAITDGLNQLLAAFKIA